VKLTLTGEWKKAMQTTATMARQAKKASDAAVRDEAMLFVRMVSEAFKRQGLGKKWKPIHTITKELRRGASVAGKGSNFKGTKALIRSGSLRRSITWKRVNAGEYFVGVHRSAKGEDGKPMVNVAAIHETGTTLIPITEKMRRYFMFLFIKGVLSAPWPPPGKTFIVIRQRSFLAHTMAAFSKKTKERTHARWVNYMTGEGKIKTATAKTKKK
jgi:hypothetical protein